VRVRGSRAGGSEHGGGEEAGFAVSQAGVGGCADWFGN
jgi:hypothetical protein